MNKPIVLAGFIIGGTGVLTVLSGKSSANLMKVFVGSYVFVLVLSFSELVPELSGVASGLAVVAAIVCLLNPELWKIIKSALHA